MKNNVVTLVVIFALTVFGASVVMPNGPDYFGKKIKTHLGLDLKGGVQLLYEIDSSNLGDKSPQNAQNETIDLIERRVNDLGVSEPIVQGRRIGESYGILVELPGISNVEEAKNMIGKTAQLKFYELNDNNEEIATDLTGSDIKSANAGTDQSGQNFSGVSPIIYLEFNEEGAKKFKEITKRNLNKTIITKLDDETINRATVQTEIDGGKAQIEGIETLKEAKETAKLINEGALPAPIKLAQESQIGSTLGKDAIEKSIVAGLIGLVLVIIFMIAYYKWLGVAASAALIIYTIFTIAIFKLIPVTLTLSGIAGFIFSIGIAVDANILIFERYFEELKKGIARTVALENGFTRSWPSIRDSNIASLITATVLFYIGSGTVKGFAVTLAIGILVSLFTSINVTRNILRFFIKNK